MFSLCYTFIHMMVMNDNGARLKYLLGNYLTDVNLFDIHGLTLLLYVALNGVLECLRILLTQKDIDVNAHVSGDPFFCTS